MLFSVPHRVTHLEDFQTSILTHWRLNTTHFLPKTENWCIASFCLFFFFFNWKGQSRRKLKGIKGACHPTHTSSLPVSQPSCWGLPKCLEAPTRARRHKGSQAGNLRAGCRHAAWSLLEQWLHTVPSPGYHSSLCQFVLLLYSPSLVCCRWNRASLFVVQFCFTSP